MGDRYIKKVAQSLISKMRINWRDAQRFGEPFSAQTLYAQRERDVRKEVREMRPGTLGKIAVEGLSKDDLRTENHTGSSGVMTYGATSLYSVHRRSYLGTHDSGRDILIELAVTAIIAEMADQLRKRMECEMGREPLTSEGM